MTAEDYPSLVQLSSFNIKDFILFVPRDVQALGLIDYGSGEMDSEDIFAKEALMKSKALHCMSLIQDLPHIKKVSGNGSLIRLALPSRPQELQELQE